MRVTPGLHHLAHHREDGVHHVVAQHSVALGATHSVFKDPERLRGRARICHGTQSVHRAPRRTISPWAAARRGATRSVDGAGEVAVGDRYPRVH
jgi:hypothetical protein